MYVCPILSTYNLISLVMTLLYQPSASFKLSDHLSPISETSTRLLHSAGAKVLVRWHMDCSPWITEMGSEIQINTLF